MSTRFLLRSIPNVLVIVALVVVAWWGHRTGWSLPGSASAKNASGNAKPSDWCETHSVPESICVECDESLMPRGKAYGWCAIHGVHECTLCNPKVAQLEKPYKVTGEDLERAKKALEIERTVNSRTCGLHHRRIQFSSIEAADKAGVQIDTATQTKIQEVIPVNGEITYDSTRIAHMASRVTGSVARVYKHLGDRVNEGEILALIDSGEVGKAKSDFLQAAVQLDVKQKAMAKVRGLLQTGLNTEANLALADAQVRESKIHFLAARQRLINLGLPRTPADFQILAEDMSGGINEGEVEKRLQFLGIADEIGKDPQPEKFTSNLIALRSPISGTVVSRDMVPGEVVDTTRMVFEIVDTSRVWLLLDTRAEDVARIAPDKSKVFFKADGLPNEIEGTIRWISTEADAKTRTVKVRAELANDEGKLRANTFGSGRILLREELKAVVVPTSALHWEGDCNIVFVRDKDWLKEGSPKVYHTRTVRVGMKNDKNVEIIAGILPGEVVATKGSEVLRGELLKNNLGEGCACCAGK